MSNINTQINKYFNNHRNYYVNNNNIVKVEEQLQKLINRVKELYSIGLKADKDFINKKLKQTPSSTQTKFSIKGIENRIVLAKANKIGVKRTFTNTTNKVNKNNKIIKPSIARNLKRSGLTVGLPKSTGKTPLKNLVQEAERVLGFASVNSNLNDTKKIQLLNKHLKNLTTKYHRQKNLNTKLNSLSRDFNFNRNSLETHDTNFNSFKRQFIDKLRILYSYDTSILTNTEKSIYNTMNKLEDVNSFIETFIYLYIKMVKPILLKKKYYGSPATLNALRKMRTELYKKIPISYNNSNKNLIINNNKTENLERYGKPSLSNFSMIPESVHNNRSVGFGFQLTRNNQIPHPLKKRVKFLELYPSKITQKNERKKVAKGISRNRLPKNNGYITASNNQESKKVNENLLSLTKQQYAHNLSSYYKFNRINNNKSNTRIVNDLSFLIWLDMCHDFYKENKNSNNKLIHGYKETIKRGDSFYTYITGFTEPNGALNFSSPMETLILNLRRYGHIKQINNDYVFINDNYFRTINKILDITSKSFNHPLNKVLDQVAGKEYFVSIDSRGQKRNFSSTIENKHRYVSLTSFTDTGSYMTATGNIMYNLKKGIRNDIKKNFNPFKITLGNNLTFSYNENKNKRLRLGIKNKTINVSKAKKNAARSTTFSNKLSKTFGDLMQILDIASIDPREKVFFYTLDQTAALIYGYIRKNVFGQNNINLILQKISPPYKIFL